MDKVTLSIKDGKVIVDSETGDGRCKGISEEFIESLRKMGIEVKVTNRESRTDDDDGIPISVHC